MTTERDARVAATVAHAYANAPAIRTRFEQSGLTPDDVQSVADLAKLPVQPKDTLIALQQSDPPFGGMLAVPMSEVRHIFMSPGPIYEPDAEEDSIQSQVVQMALKKCGFVPGDIVLNALSYHLTPAGLMLDKALAAYGCTVLPTGIGNTELQVKLMHDLKATAYVGTPSFLMSLIHKAEEAGYDFKKDFQLSKALVSAEPLPATLRATLVNDYNISIGNAYATAELGMLAVDTEGSMAMQLLPDPIIELLDPETGEPVPAGSPGEVVVTNDSRVYPLIRLGTGDMAINIDPNPGQSSQEERAITLVGRSGEARKVRGMFVHPNQLRFAVGQVTGAIGGASGVQGVVSRDGDRDQLTVRIALNEPSAANDDLIQPLHDAVRHMCRVRANAIEFVDTLAADAPGMVDERSWD